MTLEEYKQKMSELRTEFDIKVNQLRDLYAIDNNTYTVGDMFEDHAGKIRIEKIGTGMPYGLEFPCCTFFGPELKKDGTLKASGSKREVWQCNDIKTKTPPASVTGKG